MRKIILFFIIICLSFLSATRLEDEIKKLKKIANALDKQYWQKKQKHLREREKIEDNIKNLSEQIKLKYNKKNNYTEELYLLKENLSKIKNEYELLKNEKTDFHNKVKAAVNHAGEKLKMGFPLMLNRKIPEINKMRQNAEKFNTKTLIRNLVNYKNNLIHNGEEIEIGHAEYINAANNERINSTYLRIGFIHQSYTSDQQTGILLRKSGLKGIHYEWENNIPENTKDRLAESIYDCISKKGNNDRFGAYIDVAQSGPKMQTFIDSGTAGIWQAVLKFFRDGGVLMYPLALVFLLALVLIIERTLFYHRNSPRRLSYLHDVINYIKKKDFYSARETVSKHYNFLQKIFNPLIKNRNKFTRDQAERIIDEKLLQVTPAFEKKLATIAVLAAVAPLLGLLGTVSGMIQLFDVITIYGTSNPKILAGGISVALVTTQAGLGLAIPITLLHHVLVRTKNNILNHLENISIETLTELYPDETPSSDKQTGEED
ncbi:MAG TPA: MotA/TolQ/ExbB proton channel family protein [Spirochaetota bacterium]|nr:MotA/TolQ/ExbB proton channel family protein [Spirochaetota bacterium]